MKRTTLREMRRKPRVLTRLVPALGALVLFGSACTEQDSRAVDRAVESFFGEFFEFWFSMMMMMALMTLLWAFIAAGAIAAIIAGIRWMRGDRQPAAPGQRAVEPDWIGLGMIIGGSVLVLAASPWIMGMGFNFHDGGTVAPFVVVGLVGMALMFAWVGRRRRAKRDAASAQAAYAAGYQAALPPPPAPPAPPAPPVPPVAAPPKRKTTSRKPSGSRTARRRSR